jgi:DNA-binding PadR family transcriptional regulator
VSHVSDQPFDDIIQDFSKFYLLTILYEGSTHGYSIITKFRTRLGKDISPSLIYPFLQLLEKKGIVKHTLKPVGKKKRKVYKLTKEGKEICSKLFKRFASLVSTAIEPSLNVCTNCGCKVYEGGYTETIDGRPRMFCCQHCASSYRKEKQAS